MNETLRGLAERIRHNSITRDDLKEEPCLVVAPSEVSVLAKGVLFFLLKADEQQQRAEAAEAALEETQKRLEQIQHRSAPQYRQTSKMVDDLAWINEAARRALRIFVPVEGEEKP